MKQVYIAGPMRGYPQFNFPAFDKARDKALALGWSPISPADMDRNAGINEKENDSPVFGPEQVRVFIRRDVHVLVEVLRAENGDAIAMLPGWQKSTGAQAELFLARWHGLKVLDAETFHPLVITPRYEQEIVLPVTQPVQVPAQFQSCYRPGAEAVIAAANQVANSPVIAGIVCDLTTGGCGDD